VGFGLKAAKILSTPGIRRRILQHGSESAMLSGLVIKTVGLYALYRIFLNVLAWTG
jgi:hypothetical protein